MKIRSKVVTHRSTNKPERIYRAELEPGDAKPCPFCAGRDISIGSIGGSASYWVACDFCQAETITPPGNYGSGRAGHNLAAALALARWNRRDG